MKCIEEESRRWEEERRGDGREGEVGELVTWRANRSVDHCLHAMMVLHRISIPENLECLRKKSYYVRERVRMVFDKKRRPFSRKKEKYSSRLFSETSDSTESRKKTGQPLSYSQGRMKRCWHCSDDGTIILQEKKGRGKRTKDIWMINRVTASPFDAHSIVFTAKRSFRACAFDERIPGEGNTKVMRREEGTESRKRKSRVSESDIDGCELCSWTAFSWGAHEKLSWLLLSFFFLAFAK